MNNELQKAIKASIQTEKDAMDFYRSGAELMKDAEARRVFEVLAREEREHAGHFFRIYQGGDIPSLEAFLDQPVAPGSRWQLSGDDFTEKKALELAMEREKQLEASLRETASGLQDGEVRQVYELNAKETRYHYEMIESEYARVMTMVHETDMNTYVRE